MLLKWCISLSTCCWAVRASTVELKRPSYNKAVDDGTYGHYPIKSYATEENMTSPQVNWLEWTPECNDGRLHFITPRGGYVSKPGPMILDENGDLVWSHFFDNEFGGQAYNFQVQKYQGQDYLTFWLGDDGVRGHGEGMYYMLNSSYDIVHTVDGRNGHAADLHEFVITPQGTALLTVYEVVPHNLTALRASDWSDRPREGFEDQDRNFVWDCLIQEVSIGTGDLLFEWRTSNHIDVDDTYHHIEDRGAIDYAFDWFHINSVMKDDAGNYLISARYTHSITYIDGRTGEVLWILGGKQNHFMDLSDGAGLNFAWQHDARFRSLNAFPEVYTPPPATPGLTRQLLTIFDNAAEDQHYDYGTDTARGLLLEVTYPTSPRDHRKVKQPWGPKPGLSSRDVNDEKVAFINGTDPNFTVRVIHSYENTHRTKSSSQGSIQILPPSKDNERTKMLIGYGLNAVWTEFDMNGTVLCDAHYGAETSWEEGHVQSYRTYKYAWTGLPRTPPKLALSDDGLELYMSWNGATEVNQWMLQGSKINQADSSRWVELARVNKKGFETSIDLSNLDTGRAQYLRVIALDKSGQALDYGMSETIDKTVLPTLYDFGVDKNQPQEVNGPGSVNIFLLIVFLVMSAFGAYDLLRRCHSWRIGGPSVGRVRWRQGLRYKFLGNEA